MYKLLLYIFAGEVFVSVLLRMIGCHPWVYKRLLDIDGLHFLVSLSSSCVISIWMATWRSHSSCAIRSIGIVLKIRNFSSVSLSLNETLLFPFTILMRIFPTILLVILNFAALFLIEIWIIWNRVLILGRFFYGCPILILWHFFLLLILVSHLNLLLLFSLFLLLL